MDETPKLPAPAVSRPIRPKYQVFVSSTFIDLHEERMAVTWEILKAGHVPVGMENFSAYDDRGWKVINRTLETTDYYVLILAGRYGSIDDSIGMSWTEREYRRAIELGIPVLAFVRERKFVPGDQVDTDKKAKRLAELISDVSGKRHREMWTTPDDLRARVGMALLKAVGEDEADGNVRPGWYRGNQLPSAATMDEMARLSTENRDLRQENERLKALTTAAKEETTFEIETLDPLGVPFSTGTLEFEPPDHKVIVFAIKNVAGPTTRDVRCDVQFPEGFRIIESPLRNNLRLPGIKNLSVDGKMVQLYAPKLQHGDRVLFKGDPLSVLPHSWEPCEGELLYDIWSDETKRRSGTIPFRIVDH